MLVLSTQQSKTFIMCYLQGQAWPYKHDKAATYIQTTAHGKFCTYQCTIPRSLRTLENTPLILAIFAPPLLCTARRRVQNLDVLCIHKFSPIISPFTQLFIFHHGLTAASARVSSFAPTTPSLMEATSTALQRCQPLLLSQKQYALHREVHDLNSTVVSEYIHLKSK